MKGVVGAQGLKLELEKENWCQEREELSLCDYGGLMIILSLL